MSAVGTMAALAATAIMASCVTLNGVSFPKLGAERATAPGFSHEVTAATIMPDAKAGAVSRPAGAAEPQPWAVKSGETLRQVLKRWGGREGVEVVFLTDRMWTLRAPWTSHGTFEEAVADLCDALEWLPHPPHAGWVAGRGSLIVRHRERHRAE